MMQIRSDQVLVCHTLLTSESRCFHVCYICDYCDVEYLLPLFKMFCFVFIFCCNFIILINVLKWNDICDLPWKDPPQTGMIITVWLIVIVMLEKFTLFYVWTLVNGNWVIRLLNLQRAIEEFICKTINKDKSFLKWISSLIFPWVEKNMFLQTNPLINCETIAT